MYSSNRIRASSNFLLARVLHDSIPAHVTASLDELALSHLERHGLGSTSLLVHVRLARSHRHLLVCLRVFQHDSAQVDALELSR